MNITDPLCSTLEWKVRSRYPPLTLLSELATVLQEERYIIPLANIQELYLSILRRLQAVLNANGFPTPYWAKKHVACKFSISGFRWIYTFRDVLNTI